MVGHNLQSQEIVIEQKNVAVKCALDTVFHFRFQVQKRTTIDPKNSL